MTRAACSVALSFIFSLSIVVPSPAQMDTAFQVTPLLNPRTDWCGTQIRFQQKLRAIGHDPKASAFACPEYGPCDNPSTRDGWIPAPDAPITHIRLAIHVLAYSDGSSPFTTPAGVQNAVDQVNQLFLSSRIQFDYVFDQVNATEWRVLSEPEIDPMKIATALDPASCLNVWVTNVDFGYSIGTFPFDSDALEPTGGIVMGHFHWSGNFSALAHEIGHCLGLWHTFHGVSEVTKCGPCFESVGAAQRDVLGDMCSDTPPTPDWFDCSNAVGIDSCNAQPWGNTQPENCMGYTPISCRYLFTPQQQGRMRCWINGALSGWVVPSQESCCRGRVGDVNGQGTYPNEITISDIQTMITARFIAGTCEGYIVCLQEGDVNQSGGANPKCEDITIGDVQALINHLFIAGPANAPMKDCL